MTNTLQNTCVTCPNFNPVVEDQGVSQIHRGECRARPPVTHMLVIPGANGGRVMGVQQQPAVIGQTIFPTVAVDCWCALHPAREMGAAINRAITALN